MLDILKRIAKTAYDSISHAIGRITKRYYFEDFIRVYPNGLTFNRFGQKRSSNSNETNNYLNHRKFYDFVGQFVRNRSVADVGCGSGYGCEILARKGANRVYGCDISAKAIRFAKNEYGNIAQFDTQGITDLHRYDDEMFDIAVSSEVLEHIKEYAMEDQALAELKRIVCPNGLVIVGTPNSELLGGHGFSFEEISALFSRHFGQFIIFENALVPFGAQREKWLHRLQSGSVGIIISENIDLNETVLPDNATAELKVGLEPKVFQFVGLEIDTSLLHNTHSWVVVASK